MTAEVVLIATVGVSGSAWVAACANLLAAAIACTPVVHRSFVMRCAATTRVSDRRHSRRADAVGATAQHRRDPRTGTPFSHRALSLHLYLSTAVSGATLLALEVIWFRFLSI